MGSRLFVTGATGLIGRRLVESRLASGDELRILVRRGLPSWLRGRPGVEEVAGDVTIPGPWQAAVDGVDVVVHLAGAGVADRRWNRDVKARIVESRVDGTHQVVEAIGGAARRPVAFVCASAIGWYGEAPEPVDEDAPARDSNGDARPDFLRDLCVRWEGVAATAAPLGVRVVSVRIGLLLDPRGGLLARLLPIFRLGLGGPIGFGLQMMSWIHHADLCGIFDLAIRDERVIGPINGVAPHAVTNAEFSRALGRALRRPAFLPVPPPAVRVALGGIARYAMMTQHIVPRRALSLGYRFRFPSLPEALADLLGDARVAAPDTDAAPARSSRAGMSALPSAPEGAARSAAPAEVPGPAHAIRLAAIAVDGALLRADGRLGEGVAMACRRAERAGCTIVLATARPPRSAVPILQALGISGPVIACNGALIWDAAAGRALYHESMDASVAAEVIEAARRAAPAIMIGIERLDRWYTDRIDPAVPGASALRPDGVAALETFLDAPVTQVCFFGAAPEIERVRSALEAGIWRERRIARFPVGSALLQVAHPRADKGVALQRIARRRGIPREAVLAIGDGENDLGMLAWAGFPVAMENAVPAVRRLARVIVPRSEDAGVARALHRYVIAASIAGRDAESPDGSPLESSLTTQRSREGAS